MKRHDLIRHLQQLLRRKGRERDIVQKENIGVAAQRSLLRQRMQALFQSSPKCLQCIRRAFARAIQFVRI